MILLVFVFIGMIYGIGAAIGGKHGSTVGIVLLDAIGVLFLSCSDDASVWGAGIIVLLVIDLMVVSCANKSPRQAQKEIKKQDKIDNDYGIITYEDIERFK